MALSTITLGGTVTEYETRAPGATASKRSTAANVVSTTTRTNGAIVSPIGTVKSDGQKRTPISSGTTGD